MLARRHTSNRTCGVFVQALYAKIPKIIKLTANLEKNCPIRASPERHFFVKKKRLLIESSRHF